MSIGNYLKIGKLLFSDVLFPFSFFLTETCTLSFGVEPGRLWFKSRQTGEKVGPVIVPEYISSMCKPGWTILPAVWKNRQSVGIEEIKDNKGE